MKKSHIAIEYLIKLGIVGIFVYLFSVEKEPFIDLIFVSPILFFAVYIILFMALCVTPIAKREGGFVKKYIIIPAIPMGIIAGIALLFVLAMMIYYKISDNLLAHEINKFAENADEVLLYERYSDKTYQGGILGSDVKQSSVLIDYDSMEIAFVLHSSYLDWEDYEKFKLEPLDGEIEYIYSDPYDIIPGYEFSAPFIGEIYIPQSIADLDPPGCYLISYYYHDNRMVASGSTNGLALVMEDGTVYVSRFERLDLELNGRVDGRYFIHQNE